VTAAALLAVSPLLTACGSDAHPGSAAVVDGERITVSEVQSRAEDVREAQRHLPQSAQLIADTGNLSRYVLHNMIVGQVIRRAATDAGITVSRGDVRQALAAEEQGVGGRAQLRLKYLEAYAIGPAGVEDMVRNRVIVDKLAQSLGADPASPESLTKVTEALRKASADMDIDVSPRFGTWDDTVVQLGNVKEPWLRITRGTGEQA
jgi:hypothetical protein